MLVVKPIGFTQYQLRRDYVEGTSTSPVGYLEGIFVEESSRGQGIAKELLKACDAWARERCCTEFASDCELDNSGSFRFQLAAGFEEANRIICFTKKLCALHGAKKTTLPPPHTAWESGPADRSWVSPILSLSKSIRFPSHRSARRAAETRQ